MNNCLSLLLYSLPLNLFYRRQSTVKQTNEQQQQQQQQTAKTSVTKDTRQAKPPIKSNISSLNTTRKSPLVTSTSKSTTSSADRKSVVLQELKNERDTILKKGLCRSDDPMIKTIEKELRRHGVRTK